MKKNLGVADDDPLDGELELKDGHPNPHARDFYKSKNLRILAPDLLEAFPDSETMNDALRTLVAVAQRSQKPTQEKISARRVSTSKPRRKA